MGLICLLSNKLLCINKNSLSILFLNFFFFFRLMYMHLIYFRFIIINIILFNKITFLIRINDFFFF